MHCSVMLGRAGVPREHQHIPVRSQSPLLGFGQGSAAMVEDFVAGAAEDAAAQLPELPVTGSDAALQLKLRGEPVEEGIEKQRPKLQMPQSDRAVANVAQV